MKLIMSSNKLKKICNIICTHFWITPGSCTTWGEYDQYQDIKINTDLHIKFEHQNVGLEEQTAQSHILPIRLLVLARNHNYINKQAR